MSKPIVDWHPIETAPKNTILLLTDGGQLWQGFWQTDCWLTGFISGAVYVRLTIEPSHWAEMPDGPPGATEPST